MSQDPPPEAPKPRYAPGIGAEGEAWTILSYLISGLLLWTGVGWGVDHLVGTKMVFLPIGMFVGAFAAVYLVYIKYGKAPKDVPKGPDLKQ